MRREIVTCDACGAEYGAGEGSEVHRFKAACNPAAPGGPDVEVFALGELCEFCLTGMYRSIVAALAVHVVSQQQENGAFTTSRYIDKAVNLLPIEERMRIALEFRLVQD